VARLRDKRRGAQLLSRTETTYGGKLAWTNSTANIEVCFVCFLSSFLLVVLRHDGVWRARNGFFIHNLLSHAITGRERVHGTALEDALALWFFDVATLSRYVAPAWREM
jgi:hypothetical protein